MKIMSNRIGIAEGGCTILSIYEVTNQDSNLTDRH